jgi:hypothetical protein
LLCPAWLVAAFCRNQPTFSLSILGASRVRFAGLTPALDPQNHPLRIQKRQIFARTICHRFTANLHRLLVSEPNGCVFLISTILYIDLTKGRCGPTGTAYSLTAAKTALIWERYQLVIPRNFCRAMALEATCGSSCPVIRMWKLSATDHLWQFTSQPISETAIY